MRTRHLTHQRGAYGEHLVAEQLQRSGYQIVEMNWRCHVGELDIVASRYGTLVFCEVKTRSTCRFGTPHEAVTLLKQRRVRAAAHHWVAAHPLFPYTSMRFDTASVVLHSVESPEIEYTIGAF